jgi:hypothetical protein
MARATPSLSCSRQGHSHARLRHLVIQFPDKCEESWIAFSEHAWSDETIKQYTDDEKLRKSRMQVIHPKAMAKGVKAAHGDLASTQALQGILEYAPQAPSTCYRMTRRLGTSARRTAATRPLASA